MFRPVPSSWRSTSSRLGKIPRSSRLPELFVIAETRKGKKCSPSSTSGMKPLSNRMTGM